jgi:hypothetical protein
MSQPDWYLKVKGEELEDMLLLNSIGLAEKSIVTFSEGESDR